MNLLSFFIPKGETNILFGIIVPGSVLLISFIVTYMLYKHFSNISNNGKEESDE